VKALIRKLFSPLLTPLEAGDEPYAINRSHRTILLVVSALFSTLATAVAFMASTSDSDDLGFLFPVLVFGAVGIVGLVVGTVGNDRAVAKIWGSKK